MFKTQKAYQAGHSAYYAGKSDSDNPYKPKSIANKMWLTGWNHAFDEDHQHGTYGIDPAWLPKG